MHQMIRHTLAVVSFTSSQVQQAVGINRNHLKVLTNSGVISASVAEADGTGNYRRFNLINLCEIGFAYQVKRLGVARPKLLARWIQAVSQALHAKKHYMICRSDGSVEFANTPLQLNKSLNRGDAALTINIAQLQSDLLTRLGHLESAPASWM